MTGVSKATAKDLSTMSLTVMGRLEVVLEREEEEEVVVGVVVTAAQAVPAGEEACIIVVRSGKWDEL